MLPQNWVIDVIETNAVNECERYCRKNKNCRTFALGISFKGNGTCQLSGKEINKTNTRPKGTIFDPDFDLYTQRLNCGIANDDIPQPGMR